VIVVEQAAAPGGYARPFRRGSYSADLAGSELPTGVDGELLDGILAHLGVRDRCTFVPVDELFRVELDGSEVVVPVGLEELTETYAALFPGEADGIRRLTALCDRILEDVHRLPLHLSFDRLDAVAAEFPDYFRYGSATLAEVLDELLTDPDAKTAVSAAWPQAGLPPERLSFATFAQGLALHARGIVAPRGGLGALVDAFASVLGDRLLLGREAVRVVPAGGRVAAVEVEGGDRLVARAVVAAGDAAKALTVLVGADELPPRLVRRLERMRPSASAFVLVAAAADRTQQPRVTFLGGGRWATARDGVVVLRALAFGESPGETLAAELERIAPGAEVLASLGPGDLERLTGNTAGAAFGWENSPQQTGGRRLSIVTPVDGLFLAGHWTQPGHGIYRAILSGMHAARALLERDGRGDSIPDFRS
jgi:phytoene dehydrogenase-like protein